MSESRKRKRFLNWIRKHAGYGKFVIDCREHPCIVTGTDSLYIDVISLITGTPSGCSFLHCGIEPISKERATEMAEFAKNNSWEGYLRKYFGYNDAALAEYAKLDAEWNFEKNVERML